MKKTSIYALLFSLPFAFQACGGDEQTENATQQKEKPNTGDESCTYRLDETKNLSIRWVAYKHNAKVPVEGAFMEYEITGGEEALADPLEFLKTLTVSANTHSVFTQDTSRDRKIETFFFDVFQTEPSISGAVKNATGNDKMGSGTMAFTMNGITFDVPFDYTINSSEEMTLTSTIDVSNWNADAAIASLNAACEEKHTGADGVSKLWSEVKVVISGHLKKSCK